jgi:hypothetical protein
MRPLPVLASLTMMLALVGCGGGDSDRKAAQVPVTFSVDWAERTRNLTPPRSALSGRITLENEDETTALTYAFERNPVVGEFTQDYTSSTDVRPGTYTMTVQFYSAAGQGGDLVAEGQAPVTITRNGSGIDDIALSNRVALVVVNADQTVPLGSSEQLEFTARDGEGAIVAVTPGSAKWSLASGSTIILSQDGIASGENLGTSTVTVEIDGATSTETAVTVVASG